MRGLWTWGGLRKERRMGRLGKLGKPGPMGGSGKTIGVVSL